MSAKNKKEKNTDSTSNNISKFLLKNLPYIFFSAAILLIFIHRISGNDLWLHLRIGETILTERLIPDAEKYSFSIQNQPYFDHEWLCQILLYVTYKYGSIIGIQALHIFLVIVTFLLLFKSMSSEKIIRLIILLPLIPLAAAHDEMRPHIFGWFFSASLIYLLSNKKYKFIPVLLLIWANMHASFILALFVIIIQMTYLYYKERDKQILLFGIISVLAPLINPFGYHIYSFSGQIEKYVWMVDEWQPFERDSPFFFVYLSYIIGLMISIIINKKCSIADLILSVIFLWLGFSAMRHCIVVCIYFTPLLDSRPSKSHFQQPSC